MPYDARVVANYFLELAQRDGQSVSPLKLQKLVYLAHGWSLALRHQPLISQSVEAWRYGPVIPDLYHEFKEFRGGAIKRQARATLGEPQLDPESKLLIDAVWEKYKPFSGTQLSALTHEQGSAWDLTINRTPPSLIPRALPISDDLIIDEFQRRRQR